MSKSLELNKIYNMDCLEGLRNIPRDSVQLVLIDPPYNINKEKEWDSWNSVAEYVEFMGQCFTEFERILKPNGSMYFFHNDFIQIVELMNWLKVNSKFRLNSFIIWDKGDFRANCWKYPSEKSTLRSWFTTCEYCLYFTFEDSTGLERIKLDVNNFKNLRDYFKTILQEVGINKSQAVRALGGRVDHCFRYSSSQWELPTAETYKDIVDMYGLAKYDFFRSYESLREEYESLRYIHNLDNNHKNIWTSSETNSGKLHSCQKPLDILQRIIKVSSNEGDTVLDCFMGSGSTAVACVNTNRNFIGFERDTKYHGIATERVAKTLKKRQQEVENNEDA